MRKVVIVPYDQYLFLTTQQFLPQNSTSDHLNDDDDNDFSEKNNMNSKSSKVQLPQNNTGNVYTDDGSGECCLAMEKDLILTPFSKNQFRNAESILKYITKNMSWNELGELVIGDSVIKGSHVTDLIKDCLSIRERKWDPIGFEYFYGNLFDIPLSLVFNVKRRPLLGSGKTPAKPRESNTKNNSGTSNVPVYAKKRKVDYSAESDWIEQWQEI